MLSKELSEAATEVIEILKYTNEKEVSKIPKQFMSFLRENCSKTYKITEDYSRPFSEINLKPKTEALLGIIYLKYWADEDGKIEFQKKLIKNEEKYSN